LTSLTSFNKSDADLHIHSSCSDGLLSPEEIVQYCNEINLKTIAITDHDSVQAIEVLKEDEHREVELIPAVELSANIGHLDIHILAYFVDHENSDLLQYLEKLRAHRIKRARKIVENLSNDGIKVDFDRMKAIAKNSALGRPHIAEALREHGYVQSIKEAFVRFLSYHSPYYEPKMSVQPKELVTRIKKWRGIPIIAHPGIYEDNELIQNLVDAGAVGLEVWHPEHSPTCQEQLYEKASADGLLMTGGSDCHGHRRSSLQIGKCGCGQDEVRRLKDYRRSSPK
jgi:predicted metal-dependent phosphoesterase TrpH